MFCKVLAVVSALRRVCKQNVTGFRAAISLWVALLLVAVGLAPAPAFSADGLDPVRCKASFSTSLAAPGSWIAYEGVPIENLYPRPLVQVVGAAVNSAQCSPTMAYLSRVVGGTVPPGINFQLYDRDATAPSGTLTGAPTAKPSSGSQVYTYTIRTALSEALFSTGTNFDEVIGSNRDVSITVIRRVEPVLNSAGMVDGSFRRRAGELINVRPVSGRFGLVNDRRYSVSPALPAGLSLNPANGEITGTATVGTGVAATYTMSITDRAPDSGGAFQNLATVTQAF